MRDTVVIGGEIELVNHIDGETELDTHVDGEIGIFNNLGTIEHDKLVNRNLSDQHPIEAISGLSDILETIITADDLSIINCGTSTEVI